MQESCQDLRSSAGASAPAGESNRSGRGLRGVDKGESGSASKCPGLMRGLHAALVRSRSLQRQRWLASKRHTSSQRAAAAPPGRATAYGGARFVAKLRGSRTRVSPRWRIVQARPAQARTQHTATAHEPQGTHKGRQEALQAPSHRPPARPPWRDGGLGHTPSRASSAPHRPARVEHKGYSDTRKERWRMT